MPDVSEHVETGPADFPYLPVALLALSHVLADGFMSFHLTLMPLMRQRLGFTNAAAGAAVLMFSLPGNFGQPLVGYLFARRSQKRLMVFGMILAMLGAGCMGLADRYWTLVGILFCGGAGLAFYHPASATLVGSAAAEKSGLAVSLWSAGGSLGVMMGPALIGLWVGRRGLEATPWALFVGLLLAVPVGVWLADRPRSGRTASSAVEGPTRTGAFVLLVLQTVFRSMSISAFLNYLSFYCQSPGVAMSPARAGFMVGLFGLLGTAGALTGGHLSDRMSRRPIMVAPILAAPAILLIFVFWPAWYTAAALGLGGFLMWTGHTVNIVLAQEYMPRHSSMASGLVIGGAWGTATLALPFWGWIADAYGYRTTLTCVLLTAPVLAGLMAMFQPHTERAAPAEQAA